MATPLGPCRAFRMSRREQSDPLVVDTTRAVVTQPGGGGSCDGQTLEQETVRWRKVWTCALAHVAVLLRRTARVRFDVLGNVVTIPWCLQDRML